MIKIIGGRFKNRPLKSLKGQSTRPTLAIVRKAVFDMCQGIIEDANFLDLFAGNGAMGLEAISRGAATAAFVEKDRKAFTCIEQNIAQLKVEEQTTCHLKNVYDFLKRANKFDLIYVDPPYDLWEDQKLIDALDQSDLLADNGLLIVEEGVPPKIETTHLKNLEQTKEKRYGNTLLRIFRKPSPHSGK